MRVLKNNITIYLTLAFTVLSCLFLVWCGDSNNETNSAAPSYSSDNPGSADGPVASVPKSVWSSMSGKFKLDHKTDSSRVRAEIRHIQRNQDEFYHSLEAAAPYIYFIYKQTQTRGLPAELALIPVIESEFNPNNRTGNALGLWQLMPETASELGVRIRSGYDGRRDVVASTKAALAYFNDLSNFFHGNWYLAIAAYDCGQYRVRSAERDSGSSSYWSLPLPLETKIYVPRLLAIAEVVKNPSKYGVQLPPVSNKPFFTEIKLKKSVNLSQISKATGISINTLHELNPDYRDNQVVSKKGSYTLLVPINKV
jgi:membrane-bound lytic murein transglycosylase D